jgi:hypothetical protein
VRPRGASFFKVRTDFRMTSQKAVRVNEAKKALQIC